MCDKVVRDDAMCVRDVRVRERERELPLIRLCGRVVCDRFVCERAVRTELCVCVCV